MDFRGRLVELAAIVALVAAALFAWDAAARGYWANLSLGVAAFALLFVFIATTSRRPAARLVEPAPETPRDPEGLHLLLDQVPVPLIAYSEVQGLRAVNRAARGLFQTDADIVPVDHDLLRVLTGAFPSGRPVVPVFGRHYAVSVSEVLSGDSHLRLASLTDVQMEIHKAEAAALRETLHILSHEIMNSLTPVASLADIADSYLADEADPQIAPAREALEMLARRAGSLTRFIESYRLVARLPEPVLRRVDPLSLVQDIVRLFEVGPDGQRVQFRFAAAARLPHLNIDEAQIGQALINVITNAVEATEGNSGPRRVAIDVTASPHILAIRVADNGPGVPDSIAANLFSAFATTKPKGSGTGLNLARQIVLAHGGDLQLQNDDTPDETVFVFTLPVPI